MNKLNERKVVVKGWGHEDWIVNTTRFCGKRLFVKAGHRCSWHYHIEKEECFFIEEGSVRLRYLDTIEYRRLKGQYWSEEDIYRYAGVVTLVPGDHFEVPTNTLHQFEGILDTYLIEFSTTHRDEDSFRIFKGD